MKKEILRFYLNFRLYIFPVVSVLSCLILIIFVIYPQTLKLIQNQRVQRDLITKSKFLEAKASILESLDDGDLARKLAYALTAYPTDQDAPNVLGLLQEVASRNGFSVITLSVSPGFKTSEASEKYGMRLETVGSKSVLSSFINSIESSVRIIKVTSIEISQAREGDIVNVSLDVEVFYGLAPSSFGGPDSPLQELSQNDEDLIAKLAATFDISPPSGISGPSGAEVPSGPRGKANPFE